MKWNNDITRLLNTNYPIIQAPMYGVTTPQMVAAATSAGCLGSLALGDLNAANCLSEIRNTKQLTKGPFAVNIFVNDIPEITDSLRADYDQTKNFIEQLAVQHHLHVQLPELDDIKINTYQEQIDIIIAEQCKIVSFTFGNLDQPSIDKLKSNNTILIGTCTSVKEALMLEASGIDIICVQGMEAGGHRGGFAAENITHIGGMALLPQVYESVKIPIIYAGGIYNATTLLAARMLGAKGFQIGSLLIGSLESAMKEQEKKRLLNLREEDIVLTKSFSGRYARGIKNTFTAAIDDTRYILPYPYQNKLTGELRKIAKANGNTEFVNIWLGQSIGAYSRASTTEIFQQLIKKTELFQ